MYRTRCGYRRTYSLHTEVQQCLIRESIMRPEKEEQESMLDIEKELTIYNMGLSKFSQLAHEANAVYKIDGIVLVNTEIFDRYLEGFRLY